MPHRSITALPRRVRRAFLALAVACWTGAAGAAPLPDSDQLAVRLEHILGNVAMRKAALQSGAERVAFCSYCHGQDGNSLKPEIPKLAGQNAKYLFNPFEHFAAGWRKNFVMQELAGELSADDRINIAIYYASLPVRTEPVEPRLASDGEVIYTSVCAACHGGDAHGGDEYPRLAGQKPEYVRRTLRTFQNQDGKHVDPTMREISRRLSARNIDALAAYVASRP